MTTCNLFKLKYCFALSLWLMGSSLWAEETPSQPTGSESEPSNNPSWVGMDLDVQFGWPKFTDKLKYFDRLYGKPNNTFTMGLGYFTHTRFGGLGVAGRVSYFKQTGKVASRVSVDNPTDSEITPSTTAETLSLIPYQLVATAHVVPYWRNVSVKGWAGYEEYYYEAVQDLSAGTATQTSDSSKPYMISGWGTNLVFGSSVNFQLNWIDEQTVNSMNNVLNFSRIYLSPFVEFTMDLGLGRTLISQSSTSKASFARQVYGIGFLFESGT